MKKNKKCKVYFSKHNVPILVFVFPLKIVYTGYGKEVYNYNNNGKLDNFINRSNVCISKDHIKRKHLLEYNSHLNFIKIVTNRVKTLYT